MSQAEQKYWRKVYCRRCKIETHHNIIAKHTIGEDIEEANFWWSEDYIIGQCRGCDTVCFIKQYDDPSMHFYAYEEGEYVDFESVEVYPPEPSLNEKNTYQKVKFKNLPPLLDMLYNQVVANYELKHYLLAVAGLRMIVEGICNDLSIKDGYILDDETGKKKVNKNGEVVRSENLIGKINGLVEKGILTEAQVRVLHIIRQIGNRTVHKMESLSGNIVESVLEIIEHSLKNVYELKKYDSLAIQLKK